MRASNIVAFLPITVGLASSSNSIAQNLQFPLEPVTNRICGKFNGLRNGTVCVRKNDDNGAIDYAWSLRFEAATADTETNCTADLNEFRETGQLNLKSTGTLDLWKGEYRSPSGWNYEFLRPKENATTFLGARCDNDAIMLQTDNE